MTNQTFPQITSRSNPRVKWIRGLLRIKNRRQEQCFIAEGMRLLEEAPPSAVRLLLICLELVADNARAQKLIAHLEGAGIEIISTTTSVMELISETRTSQGMVAVCHMVQKQPASDPHTTLVLDGLNDPGNMGTILRTARAAAIDQVFVLGHSVDIYNPKVVRSASGAHFHLPIHPFPGWDAIAPTCQILLADAHTGLPYTAVDWAQPTVLLVGNEAHGVQSQLPATRQIESVRIPMAPETESLNVAVATGVLLMASYQARRSD